MDTMVIYGIAGGMIAGFINWSAKREPALKFQDNLKYYALFGSMGCIAAALGSTIIPQNPSTGLLSGFVGSYFVLGAGNYL